MWKIFDKITLFAMRFYKAVKFAVWDYDTKLQQTKTLRQRIIIWSFVLFITIIAVYLLFWFLRGAILNAT